VLRRRLKHLDRAAEINGGNDLWLSRLTRLARRNGSTMNQLAHLMSAHCTYEGSTIPDIANLNTEPTRHALDLSHEGIGRYFKPIRQYIPAPAN
jgi:hypothetical protein